jgi:hypothetical protein
MHSFNASNILAQISVSGSYKTKNYLITSPPSRSIIKTKIIYRQNMNIWPNREMGGGKLAHETLNKRTITLCNASTRAGTT